MKSRAQRSVVGRGLDCRRLLPMRRCFSPAVPVRFLLAFLVAPGVGLAQGAFSGGTPRCAEISGRTQHDLEMARTFCTNLSENTAAGAYVEGATLVVKVNRQVADQIRADHAAAEPVVLAWLRGWKQQATEEPVTLTVRWGNIRIAQGRATRSGDEQVTFP